MTNSRLKTAIFALALSVALPQLAVAETLIFKDLPGVYPSEQLNPPPRSRNCTSDVIDYYGADGRDYPERVYSYTEGNITIHSTEPPLDLQRPSDPYIHGEGVVGR